MKKNYKLKFFDSHAHLNLIKKNKIIKDLKECSHIKAVLQVSLNIKSYEISKELVKSNPNFIYCSTGIYPSYCEIYNIKVKEKLIKTIKEKIAIAIGECGLDYFHKYGRQDLQKNLFKEQVKLAKEFNLPLIIHCRNAYEDTLKILKSHKPLKRGGIMHCYGGTIKQAENFIKLGFYISFAGNITYKNSKDIQNVCKSIPKEKLLLETDSPYLSPIPNRGKENNPAQILDTANYISSLLNLSTKELSKITLENTYKALNIN